MPTRAQEAAQFKAIRIRLEGSTEEQLRNEAITLGISSEGGYRRLLDRILDHYGNHADLLDSGVQPRATGDPMTPPIPSAPGDLMTPPIPSGTTPLIPIAVRQLAPSGTTPGPSRMAPGSQANVPPNSGDMSQMLVCIQQQMQMQNRLMEQLTMLVARTQEAPAASPSMETHRREGTSGSSRTGSPNAAQGRLSGGNLVKIISPQIPMFEGSEKDNIKRWLERVDYVGGLYEINDNTLLLAATSRLAGKALDWYNRQPTNVISSWTEVKNGLSEYFQRKISFTMAMTKINERVWMHSKEKFIDYANDKLNLMQFLDLSERDQIDLIAAGIKLPIIQVAAVDTRLEKISDFLEHMRRITEATVTRSDNGLRAQTSKSTSNGAARSAGSSKDIVCHNCQKKGHIAKDCRSAQVVCYHCQQPGHTRPQCPSKSERPKAAAKGGEKQASVANIESEVTPDVPHVELVSLNGEKCSYNALVDSGSPISIIKSSIFKRFFDREELEPLTTNQNFMGINNTPIKILGTIESAVKINNFNRNLRVKFYVVPEGTIKHPVLLGREFFITENLIVTHKPDNKKCVISENISDEAREILCVNRDA